MLDLLRVSDSRVIGERRRSATRVNQPRFCRIASMLLCMQMYPAFTVVVCCRCEQDTHFVVYKVI